MCQDLAERGVQFRVGESSQRLSDKLGDSHRLAAARALTARPERAAIAVAVRTTLLAEEAALALGALVNGVGA